MIPSRVKVAGLDYAVKEVRGLAEKYNLFGQVLYSIAEIEIDDRLSEERKENVFVHELLHAVFNEAGYTEQEEELIHRISNVLYQVLKDNKMYFGNEESK